MDATMIYANHPSIATRSEARRATSPILAEEENPLWKEDEDEIARKRRLR
jgi:hypothetical protein